MPSASAAAATRPAILLPTTAEARTWSIKAVLRMHAAFRVSFVSKRYHRRVRLANLPSPPDSAGREDGRHVRTRNHRHHEARPDARVRGVSGRGRSVCAGDLLHGCARHARGTAQHGAADREARLCLPAAGYVLLTWN